MKRTWLAFANRTKCHHKEALEDLHYINWRKEGIGFEIGDTVYLFMSDERSIRFKTEVVEENCQRTDLAYWQVPTTSNITFKLELRKEYFGNELTEAKLMQHGFNGGRSIQHPMYNNPTLFLYINKVFDEPTDVLAFSDANESLIREGKSFGNGGEGDSHKELKEFIYNNPSVIGIDEYAEKKMEHILLSADRIDVWFKFSDGSSLAVEVKSSKSSDADILRGLYQCVKYKAVMDAEDTVHRESHKNRSILVLGGSLSEENRYVRDKLGIKVIEIIESNIR
jgi:hypothetical protein